MADKSVKTIKWAGGEHAFTLNHPWVKAYLTYRGLPGDHGSTAAACFQRLSEDKYSSDDVERVFFLGLVGSGMTIGEAEAVVEQEVRPRPLLQTAPTAMAILFTLFGDLTDDVEAAA